MSVGGLPEVVEDHCEIICHLALGTFRMNSGHSQSILGMLMEGRNVVDPITNKPLHIRAGIHSGPVVAGVVGAKMPRLFLPTERSISSLDTVYLEIQWTRPLEWKATLQLEESIAVKQPSSGFPLKDRRRQFQMRSEDGPFHFRTKRKSSDQRKRRDEYLFFGEEQQTIHLGDYSVKERLEKKRDEKFIVNQMRTRTASTATWSSSVGLTLRWTLFCGEEISKTLSPALFPKRTTMISKW